MSAGRPVVYCAYSYSTAYDTFYGHAFNVDGYDADNDQYHINWGWSGTGNGHFSLNAFANQGYTYNIGQLMVMGIEPPDPLEVPVLLPADTTMVTPTSFTAQWNAVEGAETYTLEVYKPVEEPTGVYEKVFTESFPYCQSNSNTATTKPDNYCTNKGWTASNIYEAKGGFRIGSGQTGYLTTPGVDMTQSGGKMTVKAVLKPYSTDTDVPVNVSCGNSVVSLTVSAESIYTIVLDCEEAEGQKVTFATTTGNKRVVITQLDIYSSVEPAAKAPVETGDDTYRLITGIETTSYTVTGLLTDEYQFRVKAVAASGQESEWSNVELVTLGEYGPAPHGYTAGDVNHDQIVSIKDVTDLIDYLLGTNSDICLICADMNGDEAVTIKDVTDLIDFLLGN